MRGKKGALREPRAVLSVWVLGDKGSFPHKQLGQGEFPAGSNYRGTIITSSCSAHYQQSSLYIAYRMFTSSRNGPEEQEPWGTPSGPCGSLELAQTLPAFLACPGFATRVFKNKNKKVEKPRSKQRCCLLAACTPTFLPFCIQLLFSAGWPLLGLMLSPAVQPFPLLTSIVPW